MSFETITQSELKASERTVLPLGNYVFQIMGAQVRQNEKQGWEELNLRFVVAEGDYAGTTLFHSYPDPSATSKNGKKMTAIGGALKKLELALGIDPTEGESTLDYFKRVSSQQARFGASMIPDRYIKEGETEARPTFGIFTVSAAA